MSERDLRQATARVLDGGDVDGVLNGSFYAANAAAAKPVNQTPAKPAKPSHYKVICISMYTEDLRRLDGMVEALKGRGLTKANRSALIRYALGEVDLDKVPKGL